MTTPNIRKMNESDQEWLTEMLGNPVMTHYLPFEPMNRDQAGERFASYLTLNREAPPQGVFVLEESGQNAGYAFIRPFVWEPGFNDLEIGYLIDPKFWGKGVGSALAHFLMSQVPHGTTVLALIDDKNLPSQKIAKKQGFEKHAPATKYPGYSIWRFEG